MDIFSLSVNKVKGIGPKKTEYLRNLNLENFYDVLYFFPRGYEVYGKAINISSAEEGMLASFSLKFHEKAKNIRTRKGMTITKARAFDSTGSIGCIWYNQPYKAVQIKPDTQYFVRGRLTSLQGFLHIQNPDIEIYDSQKHDVERIKPIYNLTKGISQKDLRSLAKEVIKQTFDHINDNLDDNLIKKFNLLSKKQAIKNLHFPINKDIQMMAKRRIVFEELFLLGAAFLKIRLVRAKSKGAPQIIYNRKRTDEFIDHLPFELTSAQLRVLNEIHSDLEKSIPMNRLLYGDVGSGKTIIAAIILYSTFMNGQQGAVMVPTEVLARQHYETLKNFLNKYGINVCLLVGNMSVGEKEKIKEDLNLNKIDILVSTHAILEEDVQFNNLGLVIVDEQHRFGVLQRTTISTKTDNKPHILVMSATPIPRTMALLLYGDLDISIIDEMPENRKEIETYWVPSTYRERVYAFVNKQVRKGNQVYVVCPIIEESDKIEAWSAIKLYEELKDTYLRNIKLALLHGNLKPVEKEEVMDDFKEGLIDVLIATTVIEVGIDVPKANLIVIENAERFGLAQLHQLRGRVGRGSEQSYCVLIADIRTENAKERMDIMTKTNDGIKIAEKDLELRGSGDLLGIKQHGLPQFKLASFPEDMGILYESQDALNYLLKNLDIDYKNFILDLAYDKYFKKDDNPLLN